MAKRSKVSKAIDAGADDSALLEAIRAHVARVRVPAGMNP